MEREQELAIIRRAYAKQVLAEWQVDDPRVELAFTEVRREDFLGPGPWVIPRWFEPWRCEYVPTPSADPVYLYIDTVVQVVAERHLNNGQPSGHARWIASASIKPSEHVVHIGTGTGYYTAIMACNATASSPGNPSCAWMSAPGSFIFTDGLDDSQAALGADAVTSSK